MRSSASSNIADKKDDSIWHIYQEKHHPHFQIDKARFKIGIIIVAIDKYLDREVADTYTDTFFPISNRVLTLRKAVFDVQSSSKDDDVESTYNLFQALDLQSERPGIFLQNTNRPEEIFFPMIFGNKGEEHGLYIFPWVSRKVENLNFTGFQQFVTSVKLFGFSLIGIDNGYCERPLLYRHPEFFNPQQICEIFNNQSVVDGHEQLVYAELEQLIEIINKFSVNGYPKMIRIHLPWLDCIMLGLELFVRGRLTRRALEQLTLIVLDKKLEYAYKINELFNLAGICVRFESPFENLLANPHKYKDTSILDDLIQILNLSTKKLKQPDVANEEKISRQFIQTCLVKLCANDFSKPQKDSWILLSLLTAFENITDMTQLLDIASVFMLVIASFGKNDLYTCSVLPLSGKQTQETYASLGVNPNASNNNQTTALPMIGMFSFIEPVNGHTYDNRDDIDSRTSFCTYFTPYGKTICFLQQQGIIKQAIKNVFLFSNRQCSETSTIEKPAKISSILESSVKTDTAQHRGALGMQYKT